MIIGIIILILLLLLIIFSGLSQTDAISSNQQGEYGGASPT
jgi:hypothetical protein